MKLRVQAWVLVSLIWLFCTWIFVLILWHLGLSLLTGHIWIDCIFKNLETLVHRWITTLASGVNVPTYFRLCTNLFTRSLWHWLHMGRKMSSFRFRFHLMFLIIIYIVGRLTFLVVTNTWYIHISCDYIVSLLEYMTW